MAGSSVPGLPTPSDAGDLIRRIEAIEAYQRELGPSIAKSFTTTITRLNANADVASIVESGNGNILASGDQTVATVTLTPPAWATQATVLVTSAVTTSSTDRATFPFTATASVRIGGESSVSISVSTQADFVPTTKVIPLNRTFAVADPFDVDVRINVSSSPAVQNAWSAQLSVVAFWYV